MMTRSCSSSRDGEEENSVSIPFDLVTEILKRLPAKSIARFCCVSKLWDSTLRSPNFTESFFTISLSRPKLLFTCLKRRNQDTFFFSSTQPQNSSHLAASFQMSFPNNWPSLICRPVCGLVCGLIRPTLLRTEVSVPLICKPSTGQFLTLPNFEKRWQVWKICLGYDPIDKQFKLLCITLPCCGPDFHEKYQVLTLGTGKILSWRMIECDIPHRPTPVDVRDGFNVYDDICINGVCYYFAKLMGDAGFHVIVCFDIKSEKFKSINLPQGMIGINLQVEKLDSTLVNYKDKLAKIQLNIVDGIQLWVLKDDEWSSCIYAWPPLWNDIVKETKLRCVGTTATGEIVLSPKKISHSFYLVYYNPERNTMKRVDIQGMEAFKHCQAYTFLDHVEDVKLMASV